MLVVGLFIISISSWFSLERFSKNLSISFQVIYFIAIQLFILFSYNPFYFCTVCFNLSFFISSFADLILLFFFLIRLAKGLPIVFIFLKNQILVLLVLLLFLAFLFHLFMLGSLWLFQFSSVSQSCLTLWDPMNHSMPGFPVHHQHLESNQTHVHWVGDAIQPSHPLSCLSPPALNLSRHQGLF